MKGGEVALNLIAALILGPLAGYGAYAGWMTSFGIAAGSMGIAVLVGSLIAIAAFLGVWILLGES